MEWKAALADAVAVGTAFLPPATARRAARAVAHVLEGAPLPGSRADTGRDLEAGVLRAASGLTVTEIAAELGVARSTVHAALARHEAWTRDVPRYNDLVVRAVRSAVRRTLPAPAHPFELPKLVGCGEPRPTPVGVPRG